ncbi:helix-turn-helix domain-containing protein [Psychrobacter urativorans]|uniref:DNA-binding protein n=1 Tax=Psychrobacter urativorans TaxID=45610 RepID=A0A0M5MKS0_9GAMM|nr:helix-turn-helix domain-containing protein [Psychrobacter urativorans]ALF59025.1 DNA-binding protein [Psychrobacter urativorans]
MTDSSLTDQPDVQVSFGAALQQARHIKQLSLDEVSSELFILKRHLQALEEESFDDLPQVAFSRGFVINYAKFLGLDPVEIAHSFDAAYPEALKSRSVTDSGSPLQPMGTLQRDSHSRTGFNPLLMIAFVALIVLIVFLFRMMSTANKEPQASSPVTAALTVSDQAQGAAINNQANESGAALNLDGSGSINNTALELILTDIATINITDATGRSLMNGAQTRGDYKLSGMPPFKIDINNIDNVSVLLNQKPVALDQYANTSANANASANAKQASFELAL